RGTTPGASTHGESFIRPRCCPTAKSWSLAEAPLMEPGPGATPQRSMLLPPVAGAQLPALTPRAPATRPHYSPTEASWSSEDRTEVILRLHFLGAQSSTTPAPAPFPTR